MSFWDSELWGATLWGSTLRATGSESSNPKFWGSAWVCTLGAYTLWVYTLGAYNLGRPILDLVPHFTYPITAGLHSGI